MTGRNPWAVLRVAEDTPYREVRSAFRRRARETHPDRGGDAGEFAAVTQAFEAICEALPGQRHHSLGRSTPYEQWLRHSRPKGSLIDDGGWAAPAASGWIGTMARPSSRSTGSEFATVLRGELSKAGTAAIVS